MAEKNQQRVNVVLTREGFVYLTVLVFVTLGAVLRSVNLLIFMAGMMCTPLLLNWRIQKHLFGHLRIRRSVPQRIHAGQLVNIQWEVKNLSGKLSAWNLCVNDQIDRNLDPSELEEDETTANSQVQVKRFSRPKNREEYERWREQQKKGSWLGSRPKTKLASNEKVNVTFSQIDAEHSEFHSYRCLFANRGLYKLGPANAASIFPFGLMRGKYTLPVTQQVIVAPKLGTLTTDWDRRRKSVALGSEATNRQLGMNEDEFYAVRQWRSGDNQRHIHWRSTAKRRTPMVRQFDQLSNRDMAIMLDLFVPDAGETLIEESRERFLERCELALSFAATVITEASSAVQGRVGVAICGEHASVVVDRNHHEFVVRVMCELALAKPGNSDELEKALLHLASNVSADTPIYIVSSRPEPERVMDSISQNPRIAKSVHWLNAESEAFNRLFSPERKSDIGQLEDLQKKWVKHVAS